MKLDWKSASALGVGLLFGVGMASVTAQQQATLVRLFLGNAVVSGSNPLPVAATITPSGTQDVNLSQVGGTAVVTGGVAGLAAVGGNVASGATDSGNPVKVGGKYNATLPTFTDGQRGDLQQDVNGNVRALVSGFSTAGTDAASNNIIFMGNATVQSAALRLSGTGTWGFNGATWDRTRSIVTGTNSIGTGIAATGLVAQLDDTAPTAITENQFGNLRMTGNRALAVKPFATDAESWTYAAAVGGISNTTTAVTVRAAVAASRNCITGFQIASDALGAATEFAIRDGAAGTVIWRTKIGTAGYVNGFNATLPMPLCGTTNTLLEVVTLTASITGAVYFNAQGYTAP